MDDRRAEVVSEMSAATAATLVERAAQVATAQMPLATGLRASARETESPRVARALGELAGAL